MIYLFLIYGIIIGSFLNVCIYRMPRKEGVVLARSHCMTCGYQLKWYDLIPVISYISLFGKCRKCKTHISIQYPIIELLNGAAYLGIYVVMGLSIETVLVCLLFSALLVVFMTDIKHQIIPNEVVIFILLLGVVELIITGNYLYHIIGFFAVSVSLILLVVITRKPMGMGDIKLMAAAGFFLGWDKIILALMIGAILGSVIGITLILLGKVKRKEPIAFGPFLSVGIIIAALWGNQIIQLYITTIT